jgi:hypothetical protein
VGSGAVLWALNGKMYIFAAFIGFGVFSALITARFRAPAVPLNGGQWISTLLLYVLSVAACVAVLLLAMNSMGDSERVMRMLRLDFSAA